MNKIKKLYLIADKWLAWCLLPLIIFLSKKSSSHSNNIFARKFNQEDKILEKEIKDENLDKEKLLIEYTKRFVSLNDFSLSYPDLDLNQYTGFPYKIKMMSFYNNKKDRYNKEIDNYTIHLCCEIKKKYNVQVLFTEKIIELNDINLLSIIRENKLNQIING